MRCAVSLQRICRGLIPSLSICKKGYRILGRGDAVGAGRKLPAHPQVLALTMPRLFYLFCSGLGTYIFTIATRHAATNADRAIWDIAAGVLARRLEGL